MAGSTNKLKPAWAAGGVDSSGSLPLFLACTLAQLWQGHLRWLKRCRRRCEKRSVHELRIHTRRLLAKLELLDELLENPQIGKARKLLKRRLDAFDELRDAQVQLGLLALQVDRHPELAGFHDWLKAQAKSARKAIPNKVRNFKKGKLERIIRDVSGQLRAASAGPEDAAAMARRALAAVRNAYTRTASLRAKIKPEDPRTIHRMRIAFKHFRYMVEALPPAITAGQNPPISAMRQFQVKMGAIQDLEVHQQWLERFIHRRAKWKQRLDLHLRHLENRRKLLIRNFLKSADQLARFEM